MRSTGSRSSGSWRTTRTPTDYAGAVVLDLGAHKGYFGAYALARGARLVISFEPETANLELLERGAETLP